MLSSIGLSAENVRIESELDFVELSLNSYFELLEDDTNQLSIQDVLSSDDWFSPVKTPASFGYNKNSIWGRLVLSNDTGHDLRVMVASNMNVYEVDLFHRGANQTINHFLAGAKRGNSGYRYPNVSVNLTPGQNLLIFKVRSIVPTFDFKVQSREAFLSQQAEEHLLLGGYFGILFFLIVYNGLKFVMVRRKVFADYTLLLLCLTMFLLFSNGIGFVIDEGLGQFLGQTNAGWVGLTVFFAIRFAVSFCKAESIQVVRWLSKLLYINAVFFTIFQFYDEHLAYQIANPLLAIGMIGIIPLSIFQAYRGYRPAAYLATASIFLVIGGILKLLASQGLIAMSFFAYYGIPLGAILFNTLLTLALGKIISLEIRDKMQQIIVEKKKKLHVYQQLEKVFYPHQLNAMKTGAPLESTMPCGESQGYVLTFDIQDSSDYKDPRVLQVFRQAFTKCYEVMNQGYNEEDLTALAYRIKEMGDGFICSVNYPFVVKKGANPADEAVFAAQMFVKIFRAEVKAIHEDVLCSVGIAFGKLRAYFPESGPKEYDLSGEAMILSTRYEATRRKIFRFEAKSSIITLHEKVFDNLSPSLQKDFKQLKLSRETFLIRNDAFARSIYYWTEDIADSESISA